MKKLVSWMIVVISLVIVITLSGCFLILPGIDDVNNSKKIKQLSDAEITVEKEKITQKYLELSKEVDEKYVVLESSLLEEYGALEETLKEKYETKEAEIKAKYKKKMGDNGWLEEQKQKQDEEFKLNQDKMDEKGKLEEEKNKRSSNLFIQKADEKAALMKSEYNETNGLRNGQEEKQSLNKNGIIKIIGGVAIIGAFLILIIGFVNKLIRSKNSVKESWSQIEIALKRRYDLIPNIVSTVKGFTKHESNTLEKVTAMRSEALKMKDKAKEIELNNNISKGINQIMLLSENYPELKANENYLSLQAELRNTEDEISLARERYNKYVLNYQNNIKTVPTNIFACILGYEDELFFRIDDSEKELPSVDFKK